MANHTESKDIAYGLKVSSVGPGKVTGSDLIYEPTNVDLAMKLHSHRVVYLFESRATELAGLTVARFKEASFTWLNYYYESCGRFRRSEETGRPYIKCNDCGVRFIEAKSSRAVQEWVELNHRNVSYLRLLVPSPVLGPELTFSPTVFIQVLSVVMADFAVNETHPRKLAQLISHQAVDEQARVSGSVASEPGASDFLVYGANLSIVNLEGANCYGFELKGHHPCLANYFIDGMGEEGAVFVLPGPNKGDRKTVMKRDW